MGRRIVIPTKEIPSAEAIKKSEDILSEEQGMPIRLIFLNPEEVKSSKLIWQIVVRPKERKTSETDKLLFRAFMVDILPLGPDPAYIRERAAMVWGEDPKKLFPPQQQMMEEMAQRQQMMQGGEGNKTQPTLSSRVNLPTAEKALNRQTAGALQY